MTEQHTHTPRPWDYWRSPIEGLFRIREPFGDNRRIVGHVMREDDARLIAAAPDLLAVCQMIIDAVEGGDEMAVVDAARAAVAKATEGASASK